MCTLKQKSKSCGSVGANLKLVNATWGWEDFESAGCQQEPVVGPAEPRSHLAIQIHSLEATRSCVKFPWASRAIRNFQSSKSYSWLCFCSLFVVFEIQSNQFFFLFFSSPRLGVLLNFFCAITTNHPRNPVAANFSSG